MSIFFKASGPHAIFLFGLIIAIFIYLISQQKT
ncbi:MAG: hypothetical protein ACI97R_000671, partial [Candidatus Azotimanducaceae bacterium]